MAATISTNILQLADRGYILQAYSRFAGRRSADWLPPNHPARHGDLPLNWNRVSAFRPQQLIEAVAVAAPNHCIDGWSYASRAMAAMVSGDMHACRHLAYYAQLRAGLCMLGNLGVGIFNGINFIVDASGSIQRLDPIVQPANRGRRGGNRSAGPQNINSKGLGTHKAVWAALKEWVSHSLSARLFLELVRVRGTSILDCLEAIWPGISTTVVAGGLIEAWGVDLRRGETDHKARNISSYTPQALNPILSQTSEVLDFTEEVWRVFEPISGSSFDLLDRHLLRSLLWRQHQLVMPNAPFRDGAIKRRYNELPAGVRAIASERFLLGEEEPDEPSVLGFAKLRRDPAMAMDMLSRALLLLRAATGFTNSGFNDAGVRGSNGDLRPWIDEFAALRGFWPPNRPLDDPFDLWADVEGALEDLASSKQPVPTCLNDWLTRNGKSLPIITEAERIGVWSLSA